jgi:DNA-binding MarR family transcriptional regulator
LRHTSTSKFDLACRLADGLKSWTKVVEKNLSVVGLTFAELRVLRLLSEIGPCSMVILAKEQAMTSPGMTIVVDKLEQAGFARRVRSDADRRTINVVITGKGGEELRRGLKLQDSFIEKTFRDVPSQEVNSFFTVLGRIAVASKDR